MTEYEDKPGCFGSALTFQAGSVECARCPFASLCEPLHMQNMIAIRTKLGIVPRIPKRQPKPVISGAGMTTVLPKKVEDLLHSITQSGINMIDSLKAGKNPFTLTPKFMRITCHLLLRIKTGFTETELRGAFQSHLAWSPDTATSHATQARQLLLHIGAIELAEGKMKLRSDLAA